MAVHIAFAQCFVTAHGEQLCARFGGGKTLIMQFYGQTKTAMQTLSEFLCAWGDGVQIFAVQIGRQANNQ
ncbi:Uncharacterised protein [Vibrio cholerae]|nr:Uncharacterised protein [Vibrio cholerae]CSC23879.1 Uncharacterised protein [Vibrio cholerae]CSC37481.1 Uncharacterised protein [Vibrio cholerae]